MLLSELKADESGIVCMEENEREGVVCEVDGRGG